jgi:hypothetical protein
MIKLVDLRHGIAVGAAAIAVVMGLTAEARADVSYAYSQQQISNLLVTSGTGAIITASGTIQTGTNTGAAFASGTSATDPTDAPQSYLGPPPPPPENLFAHVATFPGPDPQAAGTAPTGMSTGATLANFTRGDSAFTSIGNLFQSAVSVNNVAESYLNTGGTAGGVGGWTLTQSFTVSTTTALNIGYDFSNSLYTYTAGSNATAQANYHLDATIKDQAGNTVFVADPVDTNHSFGAPPNNSNMLNTSGTGVVTTDGVTFTPGQLYTIVISGNENTFDRIASVPEPGPLSLAAIAGGLACVAGLKRKFVRKTAA